MIVNGIDGGKPFDWGKTSQEYAKYRDIYPAEFYERIARLGLCTKGQRALDVGTGTGVLPRNMYRFGADWTGADISENQIEQAKILSEKAGMSIEYFALPAEKLSFPNGTFDVITACQCIWYLDHKTLAPRFSEMLKTGGSFVILYMAWLPFEDIIAGRSEEIILKYNPNWSGAGETRKPIFVPEEYLEYFDVVHREEYDLRVHFTRESWHGRMTACRGVGASMTDEQISAWDKEHRKMLLECAPDSFDVLHFVAIAQLKKKN